MTVLLLWSLWPVSMGLGASLPAFEAVIISEVYANAYSGEQEWIELYNRTEEEMVIGGMIIQDAAGNKIPVAAGVQMPAGGAVIISGFKNIINDSGDTLTISLADGQIIDQVQVPATAKGKSWDRLLLRQGEPTAGQVEKDLTSPPLPDDGEVGETPLPPSPAPFDPPAPPPETDSSPPLPEPDEDGETEAEIIAPTPQLENENPLDNGNGEVGETPADPDNSPVPEAPFPTVTSTPVESLTPPSPPPAGEVTPSPSAESSPLPDPSPSASPETSPTLPLPSEAPPPNETPAPITPGSLRFSEIMANPADGEEWVEVEYMGEQPASLGGAVLLDAAGKVATVSPTKMIAPQELLVIGGFKAKLNNDGDTIRLISATGEELIAPLTFPAVAKGKSWWPQESVVTEPTPGEKNRLPMLPTQPPVDSGQGEPITPGGFAISEVAPSPADGEGEWFELRSLVNEPLMLGGLVVRDGLGEIYHLPEGSVLPPGGFLIVSGWPHKLNNSGDRLSLHADGIEVARVDFPAIAVGSSWAFDGQGFQKTKTPTPGAENRFPQPDEKAAKEEIPLHARLAKKPAVHHSVAAATIELSISEVRVSGKADFVELYCRKCDKDLGGISVGDDDRFFEFAPGTFVASGEYLVIGFGPREQLELAADARYFQAEKTGLTATDETIFVLDSADRIISALCLADQSGGFSPGEYEDIVLLIKGRGWLADHPLHERHCVDSRRLKSGAVAALAASEHTGKAAPDFFVSETATPGSANPPAPLRAEAVGLRLGTVRSLTPGWWSVEVINQAQSPANTDGFGLWIGETETPLQAVWIAPGATMPALMAAPQPPEMISLKDAWWAEADRAMAAIEPYAAGTTGMVVSELVADPEGADKGQEFLELRCEETFCPERQYLLTVGNTQILLPQKRLRQGEYLVISETGLKNSELSLRLFDLRQGTVAELKVAKAVRGMSFGLFGGELLWSAHATPGQANLLVAKDPLADSDGDGLTDHIEVKLGSDPTVFDRPGTTAHRMYQSYLRHRATLSVAESPEGLVLSGRGAAASWVRVVMHSEPRVFFSRTDAEGAFQLTVLPKLSPGEHSFDLVLPKADGLVVLPRQLITRLAKNPREGWLESVEIFRVLPNPDGKDSGQELVILRNTGQENGVLRHARLMSGTKTIALPDLAFAPGQARVLVGKQAVPPLKNKNGDLRLLDIDGAVLDEIVWANARSGVMHFDGMPEPPAKTKKARKKPKRKWRAPLPDPVPLPGIEIIEGLWLGMESNLMRVRLADGREVLLPASERFVAESLSEMIDLLDPVRVAVKEGVVVELRRALPQVSFVRRAGTAPLPDRWLISLLICGILCGTVPFRRRGRFPFWRPVAASG